MEGEQEAFGGQSMDKYKRTEPIGSGAYGIVYKGYNTQTMETIAVKRIKIEFEAEGIPSTAIREISLLREIEHENIVRLKDVVTLEQKLYLIFEFVDMDLKQFMDKHFKNKQMNINLIKYLMFQLLKGVAICHSKRILHRDLKPQNILIDDKSYIVKLADFGLARAFGIPIRPYTHEVVTLWYRAPEILLGSIEYSTPVDIWSCACIMAEMYNGIPLFMGDSEIDQLYKIFRVLGTPTEEIWPGVKQFKDYKETFPNWHSTPLNSVAPSMDALALDLFTKMMVYDPCQRLSAKACLQHPYFADVGQLTFVDLHVE